MSPVTPGNVTKTYRLGDIDVPPIPPTAVIR